MDEADEAYKQKLSATVRSTLLDDFAYPQYLTDTFDSWLDNFYVHNFRINLKIAWFKSWAQ